MLSGLELYPRWVPLKEAEPSTESTKKKTVKRNIESKQYNSNINNNNVSCYLKSISMESSA